jgi:hypothetical protein
VHVLAVEHPVHVPPLLLVLVYISSHSRFSYKTISPGTLPEIPPPTWRVSVIRSPLHARINGEDALVSSRPRIARDRV